MLITPQEIAAKYDLSRIRGVLHLGAHDAEELPLYQEMGWRPIHWVEMLPQACDRLAERFRDDPDNRLIRAAIIGPVEEGERRRSYAYVASNGQSSSLLMPKTHLTEHPDIKFEQSLIFEGSTVDEICLWKGVHSDVNFWNLDLQGMELEALKGAVNNLWKAHVIYTEVNTKELYWGCAQLPDLDVFLSQHGFTRAMIRMTPHGWGDAVYLANRYYEVQRQDG